MSAKDWLKARVKRGRRRGALWVRLLDIVRLLPSGEGRSLLWTRVVHGRMLHQTTPETRLDRYPELFDMAAALAPDARRILSFGCSTGEELLSLRQRFAMAEIVGAEINPRSRALARRRMATDRQAFVVPPSGLSGSFDLIFALAVFQREPHKIAEMEVEDLSGFYPFARFHAAVRELVERLGPGGVLCVDAAHYRLEDSALASRLEPIEESPPARGLLFGPDGRRLQGATAHTLFRKRAG